jgi:hypothetical protein
VLECFIDCLFVRNFAQLHFNTDPSFVEDWFWDGFFKLDLGFPEPAVQYSIGHPQASPLVVIDEALENEIQTAGHGWNIEMTHSRKKTV